MLKTSGLPHDQEEPHYPSRVEAIPRCTAAGLETNPLCLLWSGRVAQFMNRVQPKVLRKEVGAVF